MDDRQTRRMNAENAQAPGAGRKTALLFPGQGSQYVGMGRDLYSAGGTAGAAAKGMFDRADALLGVPLSRICFEGPADELTQTRNTQPAIYLHSMVLARLIDVGMVAAVAGHSLGEYSALVYAGAFGFDEGLKLVRLRGELMQAAGEAMPGTMAAIVGLEREIVEETCREASSAGVVQCANFNSPGQVVISGSVAGVRKGMELAKQKGAKLARELPVSGAFHSPLMESARNGLESALESARITDVSTPVYANVTAAPEDIGGKIRTLLGAQLTNAVLWDSTIKNMIEGGIRRFIEVGPGKVLQGLVRRIDPTVEVLGIDKLTDVESFNAGVRQ